MTTNHIRFAKAGQLARLLDTSTSVVSNWTHGGRFAERQLDAAVEKGIAKQVVVAGIEARRKDARKLRHYQSEFQEFLDGSVTNTAHY